MLLGLAPTLSLHLKALGRCHGVGFGAPGSSPGAHRIVRCYLALRSWLLSSERQVVP